MVLQGDGVTVDVPVETFISKAGITSGTLKAVPDVPVNSFELYLPEGPDSALTTNGNLCKSTLTMPTTFTAQNGTAIHQATRVAVTGCAGAHRPQIRAHRPHTPRQGRQRQSQAEARIALRPLSPLSLGHSGPGTGAPSNVEMGDGLACGA